MTASATVIRAEQTAVPGLRRRVSADLLGGTTSIHEGLIACGELIPPHTHAHEDQCIYIVSGALCLQIGDERIQAPAGSYVIKPRGLPHAFWNPGSILARVLEITSPGGFETYYDEMAAVTSPGQALAVQAKYGITFHGDHAAELISRHACTLGTSRKTGASGQPQRHLRSLNETFSLTVFPAVRLVGLRGREPIGEGYRERVQGGFHRIVHRVLPVPVGSRDRVTR